MSKKPKPRDESEPLPAGELFMLPDEGENEPREIAGRLVGDCEDFRELKEGEAVILFLMRVKPKVRGQKMVLGELAIPRFQGGLAPLGMWLLAKVCGELPDYVMILDADWWLQAPPIAREALVFHELLHGGWKRDADGEPKFTEDGRPIWDIVGHDVEEFDAVVRRYGAWKPDIVSFLRAAVAGGAA